MSFLPNIHGSSKKLLLQATFFLTLLLLAGGCSTIPPVELRQQILKHLAATQSWQSITLTTDSFNLTALIDTSSCTNNSMRVYIEGDGLAWITRSRISDDPTPATPTTALLMGEDDAPCKVYLARPCQYQYSSKCSNTYWSNKRYSNEVIQTYEDVLDALKKQYHSKNFILIGYSGGGTVATLLAARRDDVNQLVTLAGNIDTKAWTEYHHIDALEHSLNPADYASKLKNIPQYHLIGSKDDVIPMEIFQSYKAKFTDTSNLHHKVYEASHHEGWEYVWKNYLGDTGQR